ncbi:MAG: hypothetical protein M0Z84_16160 [Gammaproteobacteria bacterium]|nr:hypothetical protein [Gammaproteobacteria bacterium]
MATAWGRFWASAKLHAAALIGTALLIAPAAAGAMSLRQMRALPGGSLIEQRVLQVLDTYGPPAAIVDGVSLREEARPVAWRSLRMRLDAGAWRVIYQDRSGTVPAGWRNPHPRLPGGLSELTRLEFVAQGNVGVVTINAAAHKTTYSVPRDLLRAHEVIAVRGRFGKPVTPRLVVDRYGHGCGFVIGESGQLVMRYWVLTVNHATEDPMPVSLYAVEFALSRDRTRVTGYAIYGVQVPFVRRRFNTFYIHYIDLFSD